MKQNSLNNRFENDLEILKEIFLVLKLTNKYYNKLYKKFNITEIQFQVLYLLYISKEDYINMSKLGDNLEMARSGVTILVDRMALAGLVKRRLDENDRRIIKVIITEKGKGIIREIFPSNDVFKVSSLDFVKQEEKELLYSLIFKIREQLEKKINIV